MILIIISGIVGLLLIVGISAYPAFKIFPFVYGSSRIKASSTTKITDLELKNYANQSYKDVLYQLEKKGFKELLEHIDSNFREEYIQRSLRKKGYEYITKILNYVPNNYKPFFKVIQSQYEYDLIKIVLRSKINPYNHRHILSALFVDTPNFTVKDLNELKGMSLEDFIFKLKKTPYAEIISEYTEDIRQGNLKKFEKAFYKQFFNNLRKHSKIDPVLVSYSKLLIDIHNIRQSLTSGSRYLVEGGRLDDNVIAKLKDAKSVKDVIKALEKTPFESHVSNCVKPRDVVIMLGRFKKEFAEKLKVKDPLSIKPFVAYLIQKRLELRNVRIILKLIHARFTPKDIEEAII